MAQRSARARYKLEKLAQNQNAPPQHNASGSASKSNPTAGLGAGPNSTPFSFTAYNGIPGSTSFNPSTGLFTPSVSSVGTERSAGSGGASGGRHVFSFHNKVGSKNPIRTFIAGHGEKTRGRIEELIKRKSGGSNRAPPSPASSRLSMGMGLGHGPGHIPTSLPKVKRWEGGGKSGINGWDGLKRDPELWFPDGDTLVYLSRPPSHQFSQPSFRISSSVLRETGSSFLEATLSDDEIIEISSAPAFHRPLTPLSNTVDYESHIQRIHTGGSKGIAGANSYASSVGTNNSGFTQDSGASSGMTPVDRTSPGIKYEIFFPAPPAVLEKEAALKYHLTTRNVFALLYDKSLVGVTLGETLLDLVDRLDNYISPGNYQHNTERQRLAQGRKDQAPTTAIATGDLTENKKKKKKRNPIAEVDGVKGNVARVLEYLLKREFDDFRNCADVAAGMLCFAEKYKLGELWREAFCHCVGMLSGLEGGMEYTEISAITKALIDRASLEIQVRIGCAEARLSNFQFKDMWPTSSLPPPPSKAAFEKFRKFLIEHYKARFGTWPPHPQKIGEIETGAGFTRGIYLQLQRDFACLYDYLVDKDVEWWYPQPQNSPGSGSNTSVGSLGKPKLINPSKRHFKADDDNLPLADILLAFDENNSYPHIPHPFPLIPEVKYHPMSKVGVHSTSSERPIKHGFLPKRNVNTSTQQATGAVNKAAALALYDATNIHTLSNSKASNELVDAFAKYEKVFGTGAGEFTPAEGRKGRWILIYGVLQTLASVSMDAPGLKWTEGTEYFLNTKLKGTPPWGTSIPTTGFGEAAPGDVDMINDDGGHKRSHCWTVLKGWDGTWIAPSLSSVESISQSAAEGNVLSGHESPLVATSPQATEPASPAPYHQPTSTLAGLRSMGAGNGDTTDNDSIGNIGSRKRKVVNLVVAGPPRSFYYKRGSSMSGDEGDDEADEDEDQEMKDVPILDRELALEKELIRVTSKGSEKRREKERERDAVMENGIDSS